MKSEHDSDVSRIDGDWADQYYEIITVSDFRPVTASSGLVRTKLLNSPIVRGSTARHNVKPVAANFNLLNIGTKNLTVTKPVTSRQSSSNTSRAVLTKCIQTTSRHELVPEVKPVAFGTDIFGNLRKTVIFSSGQRKRASSQSLQISTAHTRSRFRSSQSDRLSVYTSPAEIQRVASKPEPLPIQKILPISVEVSFNKKRKSWGHSYNRIKRNREDQKGFLVEACESKSIDGVLHPKYSIIKPKSSSPRAIRRMRKLDRMFGTARNSLLSIIA
mmetsp:Transcript_483/g.604  ORF Transcript_483/g.604 Transcript_483/m.604 type:complete len:273 (+) Transcript_483:5952-6770(+)